MRQTLLVVLVSSLMLVTGGCGRGSLDEPEFKSYWLDEKQNAIYIERRGNRVVALRDKPWICDHRDGAGTTSVGPRLDFAGTARRVETKVSGEAGKILSPAFAIRGVIKACRYGRAPGEQNCPPCANGIIDAKLIASVNRELNEIKGTIEDPQTGDKWSVSYTRVECRPRPVGAYLRDDHLPWKREYEENKTLVRFTATDPTGRQTHTSVNAGVTGTVQEAFADTPPFIIAVVADDNNRIKYDFMMAGSESLVTPGDAVNPRKKIGLLPRTDVFRLELRGFKAGTDTPMNPDCIGLPGKRAGIKVPKELW